MTQMSSTDLAATPCLMAEAARDVAAAHATEADTTRALPAPVVKALTGAGFARHFVPRAFGGSAGTFTEFLDAVTVVAGGCASAGWCASLLACHARMAAYLPDEGRRELWDGGPDTCISAGVVPPPDCTVERADGGFRVSGSWGYVSGIDFADWLLLGGWEPDTEPRALRFFAVPRRDCQVTDTWFTVGMRGTGSRTAHVSDVFVPDARTFAQRVLIEGTPEDDPAAGERVPCHAVPFRLVNGLSMIGPAIGVARGALDVWSGWITRKTETLMGRSVKASEKASVQAAYARAATAIDAADLLMHRIAATADAGPPIGQDAIGRSHRDYAVAAEYVTDAVETVLRASGARGLAADSPIQLAWRDVHAATSHAALAFDSNVRVYALHALSEPADPGTGK